MPALIRVHDGPLRDVHTSVHLFKHILYKLQIWCFRDCIGKHLAIIHVKNRRQIDLTSSDIYLGHVCSQFLIRSFCREIPVDDIGSRFAYISFIGAIPDLPHLAFQPKLIHKFLDRLVVYKTVTVTEFQCYSPVTVTPLVLMEYGVYHLFSFLVLVFLLAPLKVIVEGATRHLLELQQVPQPRMLITP